MPCRPNHSDRGTPQGALRSSVAAFTHSKLSSESAAVGHQRFSVVAASAGAVDARVVRFRGTAADLELGEKLLDVLFICTEYRAVDLGAVVCNIARVGVRRADGALHRAGFVGGTAHRIQSALHDMAEIVVQRSEQNAFLSLSP